MDNTLVVKLREETGAGVMQCKRALETAKGDYEKAKIIIAKEGAIKAEIKKERKTGSGLLETYIHSNRVAVLLEIRCETDFVAKSDPFKELAHDVTMHIAAMNPENVDLLLTQPFVKNESVIIKDLINMTVGKTGENIEIKRFTRYEL
jgi:elongation factor Ts